MRRHLPPERRPDQARHVRPHSHYRRRPRPPLLVLPEVRLLPLLARSEVPEEFDMTAIDIPDPRKLPTSDVLREQRCGNCAHFRIGIVGTYCAVTNCKTDQHLSAHVARCDRKYQPRK